MYFNSSDFFFCKISKEKQQQQKKNKKTKQIQTKKLINEKKYEVTVTVHSSLIFSVLQSRFCNHFYFAIKY